jgi:hypothetical protein
MENYTEIDLARSSETSVTYHTTTRCANPEDLDLNLHYRENLKSRSDENYKLPWEFKTKDCFCFVH